MARQVFDMMNVDESGYLDKDEIIDAVPTCVEINQCVGHLTDNSVERRGTGIATPSSRRRVDGVEVDERP